MSFMDAQPDSKLTSSPAGLGETDAAPLRKTDAAPLRKTNTAPLRKTNTAPLREAETWIFDLDNTLYPASCRLFDQVDKNITRFIMQFLDIEWDEAYALQKGYFRQFGTTMNGMMTLHGADPAEFLEFVHDIDLSPVAKNPAMDAALAKLKGRKIVFTNGSVGHAQGVMGALGVAHHFEAIFDIVASDYRPKPQPAVYEQFVAAHDINPKTAVMVEDMAKNLKPAHAMGMTCVWVRTDSDWAMHGHDEGHVHHTIDDLTHWLVQLTA